MSSLFNPPTTLIKSTTIITRILLKMCESSTYILNLCNDDPVLSLIINDPN